MPKIALQSKGFPCNSLYNGNFRDPFMELKNKHVTHQDGNVTESDNSMNSRLLEPHKAFYCNYQPDYNALLNYHFYSQMNGCAGHFYPFPVVSPFQCVPMYIPGRPQEFRHHGFQYYVVIDFEATCDKDKVPSPQEIIEFPSVLVNGVTGQLECCFQTYVRPTCNQHLTDFCKDLTGIQQTQVDRGVTLSEALLMHDNWLEKKGIKNTNFAVVTWTNWDCRVMLESECQFKKIQKPSYFNRWINLKVPFHQLFGPARCNLKEAVEKTGLAWLGRPHCGLDDAKNTARLLTHLMHLGFEFSITNSLTW